MTQMGALKRWLACLCAAVLVIGLSVPALADEVTVYHTALNDKLMDLSADTMPTQVDGVVYVPYVVFDRDITGVDLGVYYGQRKTDTDYTLTLYSARSMLVFDLNAGTCVDGNTGESKNMKAIFRNDKVYVPLGSVCSFFGLKSSFTPTSYGTLIRITNGREAQDTSTFVYAAIAQMKNRYNKYISGLNPSDSTSPSSGGQSTPSPSPSGSESQEPGRSDVRVYLAFCCGQGESLGDILDALDSRGMRALFLFAPEDLADYALELRRIVGSGHAVGLLADSQAQLEQGSRLLEELAHIRTHTALAVDGSLDSRALEEDGWASWPLDVDGRPDGRSQYALSSDILEELEGRRAVAYVTMDDTEVSAGALKRVLAGLAGEEYTVRLPVETELG
jgi:peptidoglycan/xylan/chitin deacetylase (PgdA/CDA1 family)